MLSFVFAFLLSSCLLRVCAVPISGTVSNEDGDPQVTNSVIDILSNNVEFSTFLRVVQREGMVPILNKMQNFTLLLPINSAFSKVDILPSDFNRYIVEQAVIVTDDFDDVRNKIFTTSDSSPVMLNWDGETGYWQFDDSEIVDANLMANYQNSVVHGIDTLLKPHPSTCDLLSSSSTVPSYHNSSYNYPSFTKFQKLVSADNICQDLGNLTGFIPLDTCIFFNDVEMSYLLQSKQGKEDRRMYLSNHFVEGFVGGNVTLNTRDLQGNKFSIVTDEHNVKIVNKDYPAQISDVLTSDGVVHFFNNDSFIHSQVQFTPRKYLHGLNVSSFVKELDFRELSYLIDDNDLEQTIFVNVSDDDDDEDDFAIMSSVHKNNDMYQFVQGYIELTHDTLLDSKYCFKKIGENCQKIKVTKIKGDQFVLNNHVFVDPQFSYQIGKTKIYLIDDNLTPPARLDLSIGPYYHSSRSMKYLNDLNLISLPNNKEGYTLLIPNNDAWEDLELTWTYLLHNKTAMSVLMESNIINGLVYSDFEGEMHTSAIDGAALTVVKSNELLSINDDIIPIKPNSDILFAQGVAHSIDRVMFPNDLQITLTNLLHSVGHDVFKNFLEYTNLMSLIENESYSLILPTESSLLHENITLDYTKLDELLRLHLIPQESVENLLNCDSKIPTLLNNTDLSCRELTPGIRMLQVLEGNDKEVRIMNKGCTSSLFGSRQCLFIIDRPISPEWIDKPFIGIPHVKLPAVAMGIGAILSLMVIILALSCCMFLFVGKNATHEDTVYADGEHSDDDDDEHRALLNATKAQQRKNYGSTNGNSIADIEGFSEQNYSDNAQSKAINVRNNNNNNNNNNTDGSITAGSVNGHHDHQKKNFW